jgi:hypothetical protein
VTGAVERAVRKDLRRLPAADRGCTLAASALTLARLLDSIAATRPDFEGAEFPSADKRLSSAAQAARELRGTMTELMKGAPKARSGIDDLRARRAARAAAG